MNVLLLRLSPAELPRMDHGHKLLAAFGRIATVWDANKTTSQTDDWPVALAETYAPPRPPLAQSNIVREGLADRRLCGVALAPNDFHGHKP